MTTPIKAVAYCRVSTGTVEQKNSYENQLFYFKNFFSNKEGYEFVAMYSDHGESALDTIRREEFLKMVTDAGVDYQMVHDQIVFYPSKRIPKFNEIFITNSSRFTRDMSIVNLLRLLWKKGVYIIAADGQFSTKESPDNFRTLLDINLNQNDSVNKSNMIRNGHIRSAERGNFFGMSGLYGYDYIPGMKTVTINEQESTVVKLIYKLYLEGLGERRIGEYLLEQGITTRKGAAFSRITIRKILTNEKYCGTLIRNKYDSGMLFQKHKTPKLRPRSEWIITHNKFDPIISYEDFNKAQEFRAGKIHHETQRGRNHGKTEFAGKIVCSICGKNYVMCADKNRYYACSTKRTKGVKKCASISLRLKYLEEYIHWLMVEGLREDLQNIQIVEAQSIASEIAYMKESLDLDKDNVVENLRSELSEWEERQERLTIAFVQKGLKQEQYQKMNKMHIEKISGIEAQIELNSKSNQDIRLDIAKLHKELKEINEVVIKGSYSREEVIAAISQIKVKRNSKDASKPQLFISWDFTQLNVGSLA